MKNLFLVFITSGTLFACQSPEKPAATTTRQVMDTPAISQTRDKVDDKPVATYSTPVKDALNVWNFKVNVLQTKNTFDFLVKMQYKEMEESDTLTIPDFGIEPVVQIRKGPSAYSCIIGFQDKEHQFREYKLLEGKGDKLKITTLQHYAVGTYLKK